MSMPAERLSTHPNLTALLEGAAGVPSLPISGLAIDSRRVKPGDLFLACKGASSHGLDYLDSVVQRGAAAVAYDATSAVNPPPQEAIPLVPVEELASKAGDIANRFYGEPSRALRVIGVTGTNGKSTVAWLLAQALSALNKTCAYSGTLGYGVAELENDDDMTSPDVVETHRRLAAFVGAGAACAAIEVSSHALDQGRVDAVEFDAALLTNLSRDHLDYHGSMERYAAAKEKLFREFSARHLIINVDTDFGEQLAGQLAHATLVSSKPDLTADSAAYVSARSIVAGDHGSTVTIDSSWGTAQLELPLIGDFNVANALLVLAYLLNSEVELKTACAVLAEVTAPPGRMQRVVAAGGPAVFVDYAHTPGALEVTLRALREHCKGKLWCVFGCGGDRDQGKRPLMAATAEELADALVITSDNPRGESPAVIIDDIVAGLTGHEKATVIEDRAAAIAWAIANAGEGDAILVAGKGHENYQLVGDKRLDFSDYAVAAGALA
jgi:UDP-N-acetylmuramoyl-L-alanyl-D-glutamate--2,6-diaminopimelate ligase